MAETLEGDTGCAEQLRKRAEGADTKFAMEGWVVSGQIYLWFKMKFTIESRSVDGFVPSSCLKAPLSNAIVATTGAACKRC